MTRRKTKTIRIGSVLVGSEHPIAIQSMTNTPTEDIDKTVDQICALYDNGCEIIRVTAQGKKQAVACEKIKSLLVAKGYGKVALVADVHFHPQVAVDVAHFVDKVRINPGNFAKENLKDSPSEALLRISQSLSPLVSICKERDIPIRIGVNHGSLSPRILQQCGNTVEGMVLSAVEYAQACRGLDFHQLVFSMKASNTLVMIDAYRKLSKEFLARGWDYPFHLGVTEAGCGVEGRMKSSAGIATLLREGIGDTIRVSLTEPPVNEISPAKQIISLAKSCDEFPLQTAGLRVPFLHPKCSIIIADDNEGFGCGFSRGYEGELLSRGFQRGEGGLLKTVEGDYEVFSLGQSKLFEGNKQPYVLNIFPGDEWDEIKKVRDPKSIIFHPESEKVFEQTISFFQSLKKLEISHLPIVLYCDFSSISEEMLAYRLAADVAPLLVDQMISGIILDSDLAFEESLELVQTLFQSISLRMFKTEFISCPGCGRTQYDLEAVAIQVKEKLKSFPGLKIAVMGCSVNGPGEMADSDYGCVGSKPGMVDLYVGRNCIQKNIEQNKAAEELLKVIKSKLT